MQESVKEHCGYLEVICGCMFAGKSEELMRRLRRATYAKLNVACFKPKIDSRYDQNAIASHDKQTLAAVPVSSAQQIEHLLMQNDRFPHVVGIDEIQFFDPYTIVLIQSLLSMNVRVIVAGLDKDYRGYPFGIMPTLLAISESVTKLSALCVKCGSLAYFTHRRGESKELIAVGSAEMYDARCRKCWNPLGGD